MTKPKGWDRLPVPVQDLLTMLGPSGTVEVTTNRDSAPVTAYGSTSSSYIYGEIMYRMKAGYDVPPLKLNLNAEAMSLEEACGAITWQFLEGIGMPSD
jgi:hypothetical protein